MQPLLIPHPGLTCWSRWPRASRSTRRTADRGCRGRRVKSTSHEGDACHMPLISFDLPTRDICNVGSAVKQWVVPADAALHRDVLAQIQEGAAGRTVRGRLRSPQLIVYQKDNEQLGGSQLEEWVERQYDGLQQPETTLAINRWNPRRYCYDPPTSASSCSATASHFAGSLLPPRQNLRVRCPRSRCMRAARMPRARLQEQRSRLVRPAIPLSHSSAQA